MYEELLLKPLQKPLQTIVLVVLCTSTMHNDMLALNASMHLHSQNGGSFACSIAACISYNIAAGRPPCKLATATLHMSCAYGAAQDQHGLSLFSSCICRCHSPESSLTTLYLIVPCTPQQ